MTATAWVRRHRAYLRANPHDIDPHADAVRVWIDEQHTAWLEGDGDCGFDAWLEARFPEDAPKSAAWGNEQEFGF